MKLLTKPTANYKLEKSIKKGYATTGIHLLPDKEICKFKSLECFNLCLVTAGRGVFNNVHKARHHKTIYFKTKKDEFMLQLLKELRAFKKYCRKRELIPVIRLNLTSDIDYSKIIIELENGKKGNIFDLFAETQFYDYTKDFHKMTKNTHDPVKNYDLTFSFNGHNWKQCKVILNAGYNVAMVFKGKILPQSYKDAYSDNYKVIDGDLTDLRFLDEKGVIVGLLAKGKAKNSKTASNFIIEV